MKKGNRKRKKIMLNHWVLLAVLWLPVLATVLTLFFLFASSFMGGAEIKGISDNGLGAFHLLPIDFTIQSWKKILVNTPEYLLHFWNGVWISVPILIGTVCISTLTGYGLTYLDFPGKRICILIMVLLMLLPYQVTLTPNFLVLDYMGLIGSRWAVILPSIFHPLGIVAMTYFIRTIPLETLEAARMEGAGEFRIFLQIAVPQVSGGIAVLSLYNLMDSWNMVEPILVLIQKEAKYPLSVALRIFTETQLDVTASCSVLFVLPALLIFGMAREMLVDGIGSKRRKNG